MDIYAEHIIDLYKHPLNKRDMPDATASASGANLSCGDHVRMYVQVVGDRVARASFQGDGCAISQAAASMLTESLIDLPLADAVRFSKETLIDMLGVDLGHLRIKCALLPWETAQQALVEAQKKASSHTS